MGACATKPKVLKADPGEAPAPAPEFTPEITAAGGGDVAESKLENGGDGKATEIVDDHNVDSKSRSLSNLFNNQKEGKESDEKKSETAADPPETEKQTIPPPPPPPAESTEKQSERNPPEPPPSDQVTDKTTISEEKSTTISESKKEIIDPKNGQITIEDHNNKVEPTPNEPIA